MKIENEEFKITLIGAGRVGFHLGKQLKKAGFDILQVFSRNLNNSNKLASLVDSEAINQLSEVSPEADLVIIAVADSAISSVSRKLSEILTEKSLIVHTSGATPSMVFQNYFKRFGVFYPLQTFSFEKEPDFSEVPFCIYSDRPKDLKILKEIASSLSEKVFVINDTQRARLHVAAVFVNNFTNHMYFIGKKILNEENISLDVLMPLIEETTQKIKKNDPFLMQTGPAIRRDQETIKSHLEMLEKHPDFQELYQLLTKNIQQYHL